MATTRTNIQFGMNHKIYCNELIEGSPLTTKLPFSADTNYKVHCEDFTETDSATCVTYDANKDISCNEIIEGDMLDYINVPAPGLTTESKPGPTAYSATVTIENKSNFSCKAYYSTSSTRNIYRNYCNRRIFYIDFKKNHSRNFVRIFS